MNNEINKYQPNNRMSELIRDDYRLLQVISRFGIPLGLSDKSVQEICQNNMVDCYTFLAVANFMQEENEQIHHDVGTLSIPTMLNYLKRAHNYYLDFCLPTIRHKLTKAISSLEEMEIVPLILRFFDEYAHEVREHMEFEDRHEFAYVSNLMTGNIEEAERITLNACPMKMQQSKPSKTPLTTPTHVYHTGDNSNILLFTRQQALKHKQIDSKLSELKNIIIKYCPTRPDNYLLNAVLYDIFNCEKDLELHCRIEDCLFVPAVRLIEEKFGL